MKKLLTILIVSVIGLSLLLPMTSSAVTKKFQVDTGNTLTTNLKSYYKLEDVNDYWSTNNLTNNGSITFGSGKVNNAANNFGADARYLSLASTTLLIANNVFSVSLWVKSDGTQIVYAHPFSAYGSTGAKGFAFHADYHKADLMNIYMGAGTSTAYSYVVDTDTAWKHLVVTSDGTTIRLYEDGTATSTLAHAIDMGTGDIFMLGKSSANADRYWYGALDEIGIWSKALSQTEISDLYNSGNGQTMVEVSARKLRGIGISR